MIITYLLILLLIIIYIYIYIAELNSLYEKYHNYHPRENKITKNYTLSYIQLWKLIEDCEISKNSNHTIGNFFFFYIYFLK